LAALPRSDHGDIALGDVAASLAPLEQLGAMRAPKAPASRTTFLGILGVARWVAGLLGW